MGSSAQNTPTISLALGGGAARGLAHIGVLEVLEREGIAPSSIVGSSMGGLIGALYAAGLSPSKIADVARSFRFPSWFVPGAMVSWERIFPAAAEILRPMAFEALRRPLLVTATDLEAGEPVVLHEGRVLPAVRATCAVPGVLLPERIDNRWLVDGGVVDLVPVDVAWTTGADVVIAATVSSRRARRMPQLDWRLTSWLAKLGGAVPNPATAKISFELLVRASEIALDRTTALLSAMAGPEVLVEPDLRDIGLRDFERLDEAVEAGRQAARAALPAIRREIERQISTRNGKALVDPVCMMMISPARARARARHEHRDYYFCSENCREAFERDPARYVRAEPRVTSRETVKSR